MTEKNTDPKEDKLVSIEERIPLLFTPATIALFLICISGIIWVSCDSSRMTPGGWGFMITIFSAAMTYRVGSWLYEWYKKEY